VGDLTSFRTGTRTKLGEYTNHFLLQRIVDESREELKITGSLADAVHIERLSDVRIGPGGEAVMQLL
jgi:ATP-dependent helicase/DNAse subunit B